MFYRFMRFMVRLSLHFYNKRIGWEGYENIPHNKPILFASTHSNSFLDALFPAASLDQAVYCLARGDAFKKPLANTILRHFRVLPIFRHSDTGKDMSTENDVTFQECQELFKQNQWILIFPESYAKHQTTVLPLKKGFATMAQRAWAEGLDLHIVPVSVSYDSVTSWGKKCDVVFGKPIQKTDIQGNTTEQEAQLKEILHARLSANFPSSYQFKGQNVLLGWFGQLLYYVGWVVQFPVYFLTQYIAKRKAAGTVFYDSTVVGLLSALLIVYYLLMVITIAIFI